LKKIVVAFGNRYADQIKPAELDDWLAATRRLAS
jgi:hypothetical protein